MLCTKVSGLRSLEDLGVKSGLLSSLSWPCTPSFGSDPGSSHRSCIVLQKRWRSKLNLQHPRSPHELKRKMLHVAEPIFATRRKIPATTCPKLNASAKELSYNQLEILKARWALQVMDEAEVVILLHCNPTSMNTHKEYRNKVWKMNIRLWERFPSRVLACAITDTKYEIMRQFVKEGVGQAMIATSSELNFGNLVRGLKWFTSYVPLMVIVNGERVLSYPQLQAYAKSITSGIAGLYAETNANLSSPARNVSQSIQHQYVSLSQSLDHLAKQQTTSASTLSSPAEPTSSPVAVD